VDEQECTPGSTHEESQSQGLLSFVDEQECTPGSTHEESQSQEASAQNATAKPQRPLCGQDGATWSMEQGNLKLVAEGGVPLAEEVRKHAAMERPQGVVGKQECIAGYMEEQSQIPQAEPQTATAKAQSPLREQEAGGGAQDQAAMEKLQGAAGKQECTAGSMKEESQLPQAELQVQSLTAEEAKRIFPQGVPVNFKVIDAPAVTVNMAAEEVKRIFPLGAPVNFKITDAPAVAVTTPVMTVSAPVVTAGEAKRISPQGVQVNFKVIDAPAVAIHTS